MAPVHTALISSSVSVRSRAFGFCGARTPIAGFAVSLSFDTAQFSTERSTRSTLSAAVEPPSRRLAVFFSSGFPTASSSASRPFIAISSMRSITSRRFSDEAARLPSFG